MRLSHSSQTVAGYLQPTKVVHRCSISEPGPDTTSKPMEAREREIIDFGLGGAQWYLQCSKFKSAVNVAIETMVLE